LPDKSNGILGFSVVCAVLLTSGSFEVSLTTSGVGNWLFLAFSIEAV
jgi:hypothetical protein